MKHDHQYSVELQMNDHLEDDDKHASNKQEEDSDDGIVSRVLEISRKHFSE